MLRMRAMVMTGVLVYGVILVMLHRMFMAGPSDDRHDALVQAVWREHSRLLKLNGHQSHHNQQFSGAFNLGKEINITADLDNPKALQNFTFKHIIKEWTSYMKPILAESFWQHVQSSHTTCSVISQLEKSPRLYSYSSFNLTLPNLLSEEEERVFLLNPENKNTVGIQGSDKLFGKINVLHNTTVLYETDCGFRTKDELFQPNSPLDGNPHFIVNGVVIPLLVPDSHAFQHFIDGLLPKLMQVLDYALLPGVQLLIFYPRDTIIFEILENLGIQRQKLIFFPSHLLHLKTMINTCVTPPLHPLLWGAARHLLKVPDHLPNPKDSLVILLTRAGSFNPGRNMLNVHQVKNMLALRYRTRLVIFKGGLNLRQTRALFARANIIVGVHGGAFYNLLFAPKTAHIIEFLPFDRFGFPIFGIAHQIFWLQAQLIGQTYWRLQLTPHAAGDVLVPIANLTTILDKVDVALKSRTIGTINTTGTSSAIGTT